MPEERLEMVVIARTQSPFEAAFIQNVLRGHGIGCVLNNEHTAALGLGMVTAMRGAEVLVPRADAERALDILANAPDPPDAELDGWAEEAPPEEDAVPETAEPAVCPNCGAARPVSMAPPILAWLLGVLTMQAFPPRRTAWRCPDCDWTWRT